MFGLQSYRKSHEQLETYGVLDRNMLKGNAFMTCLELALAEENRHVKMFLDVSPEDFIEETNLCKMRELVNLGRRKVSLLLRSPACADDDKENSHAGFIGSVWLGKFQCKVFEPDMAKKRRYGEIFCSVS